MRCRSLHFKCQQTLVDLGIQSSQRIAHLSEFAVRVSISKKQGALVQVIRNGLRSAGTGVLVV
ncbi:MAG: hypothetical protein ABL858_08955 [Candidatus Nitrotoga sp.]